MADNIKFYVGEEFEAITSSSQFNKDTCYEKNATTKQFIKTTDTAYTSGKTYYISKLPAASSSTKGEVYFALDTTDTIGSIYYSNGASNIKMTSKAAYADYADKAYHDGSNNTITSTYLKQIAGTESTTNYTISQTKGSSAAGTNVVIPAADTSKAGLVTTGTQTFAGAKTFNDNVTVATGKTVTAPKFIGALQGNADTATSATSADEATKLATARSLQTDLSKSGTVSFDGTANVTLGITGTLPIGNGGTGTTSTTTGGIVYGASSTAYGTTAAGTAGYLLQSNGTNAPSWINATNSNTASTIVKRDASGNFSAGTITASLSGNASTADKVNHTLTFGSKVYDGSVGQSITAADLGLSTAMHFEGTTTTALTDGATTSPVVISGSNHTPVAGDVVLYNDFEFVWTGSAWEELGSASSYQATAKTYADSAIKTAIEALDVTTSANSAKYVSNVNETDGKISVTFTDFSPSVTIGAGTSSNTPTVNITVGGNSGTAQSITKASTSVFGATKLTSTASSTEEGLAITPKGADATVTAAIQALDVSTTADSTKYVSNVNETDGKISVVFTSFSPAIEIGAGSSTAAPTVNVSVGGNKGTAQSITTATTGVYGVTKLTSTIDNTETVAATPKAVNTVKATADAAMPKSGGTFTGAVTFNSSAAATFQSNMSLASGKTFTVNGKILANTGDATFSRDTNASILTYGGIAASQAVATKKVRVDNDTGSTKGNGCEMIYNSTQNCLEFTFT